MPAEDIAKREEEAQKQRDLARLGRGQTSTRSIKPPVAASEIPGFGSLKFVCSIF